MRYKELSLKSIYHVEFHIDMWLGRYSIMGHFNGC